MPRPRKGHSLTELIEFLRLNGYQHHEVAKGYSVEELIRDLEKVQPTFDNGDED